MIDEIQLEKQNAYHTAHSFKGVELQPFSEGRRMVAMSIGVLRQREDDGDDVATKNKFTLADIHAIIFICLTEDRKVLRSAHRDPDAFWGKIMDWADANITEADYAEEAEVATNVLTSAFATQVEPVPDTDGPLAPDSGKN
jgi:hypothetical protein